MKTVTLIIALLALVYGITHAAKACNPQLLCDEEHKCVIVACGEVIDVRPIDIGVKN